jgi:cell wall-associated NlpC family hydrolase
VASTRKPIRAQLVIAAGASLALVLGTPVLSAHADPVYPSAGQVNGAKAAVGDKVAQVAAVQAQLMASNARLDEVQTAAEVASEKYNLARILLQQRTDAAKGAGERAASAQQAAGIASDKLGQLAATTYMQGGNLGQLEAFLSSSGPQEVLDRAAGIQLITDIRGRIMQDANASSVVAGVLRRAAAQAQAQQLAAAQEAESARAQAQAQVDAAAAETASIQAQQGVMIAQLATLRSTSVALEKQRQDGLKAQAQARAAAAAQARVAAEAAAQARAADQARSADQAAQAAAQRQAASAAAARRNRKPAVNQPVAHAPQPGPASTPGSVSQTPVPSNGGVSAVIAFAQAHLKDPYVYGAAGPNTWDCSGLTMMAWAQAGVNLGHNTGVQWAETRHVPLSDLQPGDLVFYGADGPSSHHVGLYVGGKNGNEMMIEAPHTGDVVKYSSIWRGDILPEAGRP